MGPDEEMDATGYENLKKVEYWLKKAAAQGFEPAVKLMSELDELFQWGKQAFGDRAPAATHPTSPTPK